jgi:hypothetical protein
MNPAKAMAIYLDEFRKVYQEKGGPSQEKELRRQAREEAEESWNSLFGDPLEREHDRARGFHKARKTTPAEYNREFERLYNDQNPWNCHPYKYK